MQKIMIYEKLKTACFKLDICARVRKHNYLVQFKDDHIQQTD